MPVHQNERDSTYTAYTLKRSKHLHLMSQYMSNQPYRSHSWICMFVYIVHVHMPYRGCAFRMLNEIQILTRCVWVCVWVGGCGGVCVCVVLLLWWVVCVVFCGWCVCVCVCVCVRVP